ncbi:MAG: hypothetical protein WCK84_12295 [Bacteroidota bacterium]
MKIKLLLLSVLLIVSVQLAKSQSKKELESNLTLMTASKDSIQKLLTAISARHDSVSKACLAYDAMYKTIKEKIVHYDFKPTNFNKIADSMQISVDSAFKKSKARFVALSDSVKMLSRLSDSLRNEIGHLAFMVNKYIGKGTVPADKKDLSGTWEFNVRWYKLAGDSIQSGINLMTSSPDSNSITKLVFVDFETVLVIFSKGDSIKCFYQVNSFAKDKPWTMDITRGTNISIRLNANPFDGELYVSYRKGDGFYYGFMRKK